MKNSPSVPNQVIDAFLASLRSTSLDCKDWSIGEEDTYALTKVVLRLIIRKVEEFGLSEDAIRNLERQLKAAQEGKNYSFLEWRLLEILVLNKKSLFGIASNGEIGLAEPGMIIIDLRTIFNEIFPGFIATSENEHLAIVSESEGNLLDLIRKDRYHSFKIYKKKGELDRVECHERVEVSKRIIDVLQGGNFQDVAIRQEAGKVVWIDRTVKKKLNTL